MDRETAKDKVAKLMAIANDGRGNEFEADAALRQAEALMRKHGIDAAMVQDRTRVRPVYTWATVSVPAGAPMPIKSSPLWFGILISGIGRFTDCKVSYTQTREHGVCATFAGDSVDVEYAVWLCKHLRDDCRRASSMFAGDRSERDSFRKAYASRVGERMRGLLVERREALRAVVMSSGTALVVVDQKIALRDAEFGKQTYGRARWYRMNYTGATAGRAAGDRATINRPIGSESRRALT